MNRLTQITIIVLIFLTAAGIIAIDNYGCKLGLSFGSASCSYNPAVTDPQVKTPVVNDEIAAESSQNVEVKNGVQYVTINARGGYSPRSSNAKAGIPTKILMKTDFTYDCSAALVIRSLGYQGMLPPTGNTEIDAGTPKAGDSISGTCSMGMFNFKVKFN